MAKRKKTKRKTNSSNSFMIFFIIIIVLAILSFIVTYYVTKMDSSVDENVANIQETETEFVKEQAREKFVLEGTWASYNDGAMLTINGRDYTIELPSVDDPVIGSGKVVVVDNIATFVNTNQDSDCGIKPGKYEFDIVGDEVTFRMIDDSCGSRKVQLIATWFKV